MKLKKFSGYCCVCNEDHPDFKISEKDLNDFKNINCGCDYDLFLWLKSINKRQIKKIIRLINQHEVCESYHSVKKLTDCKDAELIKGEEYYEISCLQMILNNLKKEMKK